MSAESFRQPVFRQKRQPPPPLGRGPLDHCRSASRFQVPSRPQQQGESSKKANEVKPQGFLAPQQKQSTKRPMQMVPAESITPIASRPLQAQYAKFRLSG